MPAYYRLVPDKRRYYVDYTGTGNSMNMRHPHVLQLIMDSLRYWVNEMHVDGFRFDLAATLARELHEVDRLSSFFDLIQQDPVVSQVKLIAEPWDVGEGGYQVGNFPPLWSEWNGKYRDTVRDFWRGTDRTLAEFAYRLTGSSDLYQGTARSPYASINFITAHDGFTLNDLVSYNDKHNEANGEENRDGESHNRSWNCGAEGATKTTRGAGAARAPAAQFSRHADAVAGCADAARRRRDWPHAARQQQRLLSGQPVSWYDWDNADARLLQFTRRLIRLRNRHPVFCRRRWFQGREPHGPSVADIGWFLPSGTEMSGRRLAGGLRQVTRRVPQRRRDPDAKRARRTRGRRQFLRHVQRPSRGRSTSSCRRGRGAARWTLVLDTFESGDEMSEERLGRELNAGDVVRGAGVVARPPAPDRVTCRATITSVDLITASASSPRRNFSSSTASLVMMAVKSLIADPQPHLREQSLAAHLVDDAAELVASAQGDDGAAVARRRPGEWAPGRGQQPFDLGVRDTVMPAGRRPGPEDALVNPLFQRRIADAEAAGGFARGVRAPRLRIVLKAAGKSS